MTVGRENGATSKRVLHFVLRYNDKLHGFDTIAEHRQTLAKKGGVWMGKFGVGVALSIVDVAKKQVESGIDTWVYLTESGRTELRGRMTDIFGGGVSSHYRSPNPGLTPRYYSAKRCSVWFLLDQIKPIKKGELDSLRLYKEPGLAPMFTSMRGLMYVTVGTGGLSRTARARLGRSTPRNAPDSCLDSPDPIFDEMDW